MEVNLEIEKEKLIDDNAHNTFNEGI